MALQSLTYLKSRFEKGDYPDENDFKDLIDSCFNYSLSDNPDYITFLNSASGNWELTYNIVDFKRYSWDEAYNIGTSYRTVSSSYATLDQITNLISQNNTSFLKLSGGNITGNLTIQGELLSADNNLYDLFKKIDEYQSIEYNENDYKLTLSNSNFVNLSSLKSVTDIQFTHAMFNPEGNKTYVFGQLNIEPLNSINFSNCYRSFYKGAIKELTIQNSYTPGTSETSSFVLVNRTQNLSSNLVSDIRYTDALAEENTNLSNTLKNGVPAGWVTTPSVVFDSTGMVLTDELQNIITNQLTNSTKYAKLSVYATGRATGGANAGVRLLYSQNGVSYVAHSVQPASLFEDSTLNWGEIVVVGGISNTFTLKIETTQPVRVYDFNVIGFFPVDTRLEYVNLTTPLQVYPGDLLDVRLTTGNYITPPTNVINLVNAKLDITG